MADRELDDLTTDELKRLLRDNGVEGYSSKTKPELVDMAEENDLDASDLSPAEDTSGSPSGSPMVSDSSAPSAQRGKTLVANEEFSDLDPITESYVAPRPAGPGRNPGLDYPTK